MGHLEAHARLALMLMEGTAQVPKDVASAFRIASQGASKNCWHCIGVQAMCYLQGAGVQKDIATGTRLARESAKQDSYVGLYAMGRIYDQCVGIAPNVHNSKTGADRAPTHTHSHGMYPSRLMLKTGAHYYRQSAALGFDVAQYHLGELYEAGRGVTKDGQEALRLYCD